MPLVYKEYNSEILSPKKCQKEGWWGKSDEQAISGQSSFHFLLNLFSERSQ
jgi:hypothetical protein